MVAARIAGAFKDLAVKQQAIEKLKSI